MFITLVFDINSIAYHDILSLDGLRQSPTKGYTPMGGVHMENEETRDQTMQKIEFHLPTLTDAQLRMVAGFIRGIKKSQG